MPPSRHHSLLNLVHARFTQPLVQSSQSLQTRVTEHSTATGHALLQSSLVTWRVEVPFATRLDLTEWQEGMPLTQQRGTKDLQLDGATPQQIPSSTYSPLSQSVICVQIHRHLLGQWLRPLY